MKSKFVQSALLLALVGGGALGASAWAMNADRGDGKPGCAARHGEAVQEKWEARREARLDDLKEKLKLAPSQEAAWQAFTQSAKPGPMMQNGDREAMRASFARMSAPERMDAMLQKADLRRAHMAARADAVKAFYAQLTPEQQAVFDAESMPRDGRGHGHHGPMHRQS